MEESTQSAMTAGVPVTGEEMPEPPPEVIEAARTAPDQLAGHGGSDLAGRGSATALGADRPVAVGSDGRDRGSGGTIRSTGRPPQMLDWSEPTDAVDGALQLAATGYGPGQDVSEALARAEVSVLVTALPGSPLAAASPEGTPVIPVYTSQSYLESVGRLLYDRRPVAELARAAATGACLVPQPDRAGEHVRWTPRSCARRWPGCPGRRRGSRPRPWRRGRGPGPVGPSPSAAARGIGKPARAAKGSTVVGAGMACRRNGPRRELNHRAETRPRPVFPFGRGVCHYSAHRPPHTRPASSSLPPRRESPGHAVR